MHLLKHITVWGLCAAMLTTQPVFTSADSVSTQSTTTYSADVSTAKQDTTETSSETSSEDSSTETSSDNTSNSSSESDTSENNEDTSATTEETTTSSSETTTAASSQNTEQTEESSSFTQSEETSKTTKEQDNDTDSSSSHDKTTEDRSSANKTAKDKKTKKKNTAETTEDTEEKELIKLDDSIVDEEDSAEKESAPGAIIPKIYGNSQIVTRDDAEYMGDFVYFNQTDSIWNQNGYQISSAGCGPTSMAVVISSLTDEWVTPIDTTVWAYNHGYYSSAGSSHSLIPALSEAYGLRCKGVSTDYASIKKALHKGKPVVALMGPGYFTRKGHFMVLIDIDENDNVTVADVGSRQRSSYKYALSDIIRQSKSASAGGPFWVISKPKKKKKADTVSYTAPQSDYVLHVKEGAQEKTITFHLGDKVSYNGTYGLIVKFENRKAYVLSENETFITTTEGKEAISLSDLQIVKTASSSLYTAVTSFAEKEQSCGIS